MAARYPPPGIELHIAERDRPAPAALAKCLHSSSMKEILTVDEVAALLMCTKETIELCARQGKLPGVKFSRSWVFPREALLQRVNEMALAGTPSQSSPTLSATGRRRQVPPVLPGPPPSPDREALLKVIREGQARRPKRRGAD